MLNTELNSTCSYSTTSLEAQKIVDDHRQNMAKFYIAVSPKEEKIPTKYWIPKLHKTPYKARFIANASSSTTTKLSILLTSCLTTVRKHLIRYCDKVYENSGLNLFWSIKNSTEVLDKFKMLNFACSTIGTFDFSTLYTSLPHDLIKSKLITLVQKTFGRENVVYLACNETKSFFTNDYFKRFTMWTCTDVCNALAFLLDNIFIRYGGTVYRQIVGIPMGTNCAPLVADLFLYCYERDFMLSLSPILQTDVIKAFNMTSRYLDDILIIDNPFFVNNIKNIYPSQLTLNKANHSDVKAAFLDLDIAISNGIVSTKIYDKRDDFNFDIVNYPHLDGDCPRATSYGVYISQLTRFARVCTSVKDFNERNLLLQINYFSKVIDITSSGIPFPSFSIVILNCWLNIKAVRKHFCDGELHILFFMEMLPTRFAK